MKRLLLLAILIGSLFSVPNSFAQSSKPKHATIKYENGVKYVGEIRKGSPKKYSEYALINKVFIGKKKIKHGKGIMYFANGDQLDGEWNNDQCKRGTYKFANGDVFEGEITTSSIRDGKMIFSSNHGTMTFTLEGVIRFSYKTWTYPANCSFTGTIKDKKPYTGTFDCTLTTEDGDRFTGRLSDGHFGYGKIEYANGDSFEGSFISDAPSSGKYYYGSITEITRVNHKWEIPAGCVFEGRIVPFTGTVNMEITNAAGDKFVGKLNNGAPDEGKYRYGSITEITRVNHKWEIPAGCVFEGRIVPFTGTVNMEITNAAGDKFVGKLNNGAPDEGTMFFAATGYTETGKWKDGLSPREYQIQQHAKERALDSITKAFVAQQRIKARADSQKHQAEEQKKQAFVRKYGQRYGSLLYQGKLELGMTQQMCQEVIDIKSYDIGKSIRSGHRVETWTFNKDKQDMQIAAAMTQLSGEQAMALALLMGFADSVGASTPKYSVLVFTDGKLTSLY